MVSSFEMETSLSVTTARSEGLLGLALPPLLPILADEVIE
jgi:hypothetical protein